MKRIISMLLLACTLLATLAACTPVTPSTQPNATTDPTSTPTSTTTATPEKFSMNKENAFIFEYQKVTLSTNRKEGTITWTSSDPAVASVSKDGLVTGLKKGNATITATNGSGEITKCEVSVVKVSEFFTLSDYTKLELKQSEIDAEIKKEFDSISDYYKTKKAVARELKKGDVAAIYYVGTLDGESEPFANGTGAYDLELGSESFIPGFEDGLVGCKKGQTVTLNLTFPQDYGEEGTEKAALNGKKVSFEVTINEVYEYVPAEITDALIEKATGAQYKTIKEFNEYLQKAIREYIIIEKAIAASKVIGYETNMLGNLKMIYLQNQYGYAASMYGVTIAEYIKMMGKTEEQINEEADKNAKPYLEQLYLCYGIIATHNPDGDIPADKRSELVEKYVKLNNFESVDELKKYASEADIDNYVTTEYALELLGGFIKFVDDTAN